ncbi:MAG TPA: type IVB secretion system protein IcmH/DotU [Chitinispirillaceae bacterium]|nr:type IVB secretion system protein IcmH/DotU [Chitinispirillaceae bacterium]
MLNNLEKTISTRTLNINLSKMMDPTVSINTLCNDIFLIIISMREHQDLGTPESLRKLLKHYIEMFMLNCSEMGIDSKIAESVKFALIALIDETVRSIPGKCCDFWNAQPLQFEYYTEQMAGEKFYEDLKELIADPQSNYATLETFFYCLSLGFQGQYLGRAEEREKVIHQLATVLIKTRMQTRPSRKKTVVPQKRQMRVAFFIPLWMITTVTAAVVVIIWLGTSISVRSLSKKPVKIISSQQADKNDHY